MASGLPSGSTGTPCSLSALLGNSYKELESLRHELSISRNRAERAERLFSSLPAGYSATSPSFPKPDSPSSSGKVTPTQPAALPESAAIILLHFENRAVHAEAARDEAEAKSRVITDNWAKFDTHLATILHAFSDARARYGRILSGSEMSRLADGTIRDKGRASPLSIDRHVSKGKTNIQKLPLETYRGPHPSPHPDSAANPMDTKRPRTPSLDGSHNPTYKKSRRDYMARYSGELVRLSNPPLFAK